MQDDAPRQLDFNSMAAYYAAHLIDAKAKPTTGPYQPRTTASDALRLHQLVPPLQAEDHPVDHLSRRRRTNEQNAEHTGTMSPAPGTFASAEDDNQQSTTPASGRRNTRSRAQAKKRASPPPTHADETVYPSKDDQPPSTLKKVKMRKTTTEKTRAPTWDQIIAAKGRTSKSQAASSNQSAGRTRVLRRSLAIMSGATTSPRPRRSSSPGLSPPSTAPSNEKKLGTQALLAASPAFLAQ
jgi:hypothetical protein